MQYICAAFVIPDMPRFLIKTRPGSGILCSLGLLLLFAISCSKYEDVPGQTDPRLARKYCNDPEAVNFNREFPGTEDNSTCFYPADAFQGQFAFIDSIYDGSGEKFLMERPLLLTFSKVTNTQTLMSGFCNGISNPIKLTANRQLRAVVDTTVLTGQMLCRVRDTVSGSLAGSAGDSLRLRFSLIVFSDTGVNLHQGTAYRQ
jgi:hypothetical protein